MPTTTISGHEAPSSAPAAPLKRHIVEIGYEVGGKAVTEAVAVAAAKYFAVFDAMLRDIDFGIASRHSLYHMSVHLEGRSIRVRALPSRGLDEGGAYIFRLKPADRPPEPEIGVYALVALDIPAMIWMRACDIRKSVRITRGEFQDKARLDRAFELCFAEAKSPSTAGPQLVAGGNGAFDFGGHKADSESNGPRLVQGQEGS